MARSDYQISHVVTARLQALGLDIDQSTLSRIENGERIVTDVEVLGICRALKIEVAELFRGRAYHWNSETWWKIVFG